MADGIVINTDGACRGNPGPGGYAAVIEIPNHSPITVRGGEAKTTNNRMEMLAVIQGVRELTELADVREVPVTIRSDSEYVVNAFNKGWIRNWQRNGWKTAAKKPVKNRELWEQMASLTGPLDITFVHVRGHSGDPMNELCDRIAGQEAEKARASGQDRPVQAEHGSQAEPEPEREQSPFDAGYQACRREITAFLEQLGEIPHPPRRNYADGFEGCRKRVQEFLDRMEKTDAFRPAGPHFEGAQDTDDLPF